MILDGHNDLALRLMRGEEPRHLELDRAVADGFAGGFFALFVAGDASFGLPTGGSYALPLFPPVPQPLARRDALATLAALEQAPVSIVTSVEEIRPDRVNAIVHLEGAEPLAVDLSDLDEWYARGLRSLSLTWARANDFAEGVPFRFPSSPDTGPGLTPAGLRLVQACNLRGILVDVSHLNERGFWDVAAVSQAPLVATHSNVHALCASSRNLTDLQLEAIGASGGIVGVNFAVSFLRADGADDPSTPLSEIVRHIDYLVESIGIDHVGFGSDFEGAVVPAELGGSAGLPRLLDALAAAGYGEAEVAKIASGNWLRVLAETWSPWSRYARLASEEPHETLLDALERFAAPGLAVDLGAGAGPDSLELLRRGWSVVAIDAEPEALARLRLAAGADSGRLETRLARFEAGELPRCDLLNASFSLPYCPPEQFESLWRGIVAAIRPGGRFCGQLFGPRDQWAETGISVHDAAGVARLLEPFEVERLDEVEEDSDTVAGTAKHWHLFHIVARKR